MPLDKIKNVLEIFSGNILGINNLTVFKQEAPSPTSSDVTTLQVAHKSRQSTSSTRHSNMAINSTMDDNQNMFNNTINQLLSQESLAGLHNVIESKFKLILIISI